MLKANLKRLVERKVRMSKKTLSLFLLIFGLGLLIGSVLAPMITQYRVSNVSAIKTLGVRVYYDQNCTMQVASIEWGILEPQTSTTKTLYSKSLSNVAVTLYVYAENWNPPECEQYMALTANPNNAIMKPDEVVEVSLTLSIAQNVTGITTFSFDIVFNGSG